MTGPGLITVSTAPGVVVVILSVDATVALVDSMEFTNASGGLSTVGCPLSPEHLELLRAAAAQAAADADLDHPVVLGGQGAPLRLVGGGDRC